MARLDELGASGELSTDEKKAEAGYRDLTLAEQAQDCTQTEIQTSNRDELIECIKRGQRPTWVPKPGLKALYAEEEALREKRSAQGTPEQSSHSPSDMNFSSEDDFLFGPWTSADEPVERPRSALHRGNFTERHSTGTVGLLAKSQHGFSSITTSTGSLSDSPPSWLRHTLQPHIGRAVSDTPPLSISNYIGTSRPRAPSLGSSLSSSLIMRVPTSPLVNAVNNSNLDFSPKNSLVDLNDGDKKGRRRTMPPSAFHSYSTSSVDVTTPNFSRPLPHPPLRRESSLPHQTHQSRRSLGSFTYQPSPSPSTSRAQIRRPSIASEMSPRQRLSMVGSFEESILRGRMSSPASKPFDFVAQIGVMGKGDCPSNLKCPAHVSVPFQAVFYNYPSSQLSRSIADDAPSPYVGTVDIEHNLKPVQLATKKKRPSNACEESDKLFSDSDPRAPENTPIGKALARESQAKQEERSPIKINLGGAYRVPQQGQLQIVIKNTNKTAVKLFLVPYDLQSMQPGTKTFVRQRSYSSGPIIEGALTDKSKQPEFVDPLKDKNILRYLIHLRFCCPAKGKFYLYDNIRVVFANRVPDGKEKLRNEIQLPEPRYSPWKAAKATPKSTPTSSTELFSFERSSQYSPSRTMFDDLRTMQLHNSKHSSSKALGTQVPEASLRNSAVPVSPLSLSGGQGQRATPFVFPDIPTREERSQRAERPLSPIQGFFPSTSQRSSPIPRGSSSSSTSRSFSPVPVEAGNGLLSRQFRGLAGNLNSNRTERSPSPDPGTATTSLTSVLSDNSNLFGERGHDDTT